jgi:hypothetical protein
LNATAPIGADFEKILQVILVSTAHWGVAAPRTNLPGRSWSIFAAREVGSARPRLGESQRVASHHTLSLDIPLEAEETSMAGRRRFKQRFAFASDRVGHDHHHRPVLEALERRVVMATFTVDSLGDAWTGSNDAGDLRYCINR